MAVSKQYQSLPTTLTIMVGPPTLPESLVKAYMEARRKDAEGDHRPAQRGVEIEKDTMRNILFGQDGNRDVLRRLAAEAVGTPVSAVAASIGVGCQHDHWGPVLGINLDESKLEDGSSLASVWDAQATRRLAGFLAEIFPAEWMFTAFKPLAAATKPR